jgi:hypothetical protein
MRKRRPTKEIKKTTMEDPHSPATSMWMSKLLIADAARHKIRGFQLDVIIEFLQRLE